MTQHQEQEHFKKDYNSYNDFIRELTQLVIGTGIGTVIFGVLIVVAILEQLALFAGVNVIVFVFLIGVLVDQLKELHETKVERANLLEFIESLDKSEKGDEL